MQAYNAQIAVDAEAQIIVAADVTQQVNDKQQLGADVRTGREEYGSQTRGGQRG